jgi:tetratricopeptide (TPR) repeat protein
VIYSAHIPLISLPDYNVGYAFSVLYADHKTGTSIPYWLFTSEKINELKIRPGVDKPVEESIRTIHFRSNSSDGISISYQPSRGCLQVLSPIYQFGSQSSLSQLSNLARIQAVSNHVPNPAIFGPEPLHDWCFFFEKGDLARQFGNWSSAVALYEQATSLGLSPKSGSEYLPFIEAYAQQDDFDEALHLTDQAQKTTSDIEQVLCSNWQRFSQTVVIPDRILGKLHSTFGCTW